MPEPLALRGTNAKEFPILWCAPGQLNVLVYGVLLIVLFTAFREGMVPLLEKAWRALRPPARPRELPCLQQPDSSQPKI